MGSYRGIDPSCLGILGQVMGTIYGYFGSYWSWLHVSGPQLQKRMET